MRWPQIFLIAALLGFQSARADGLVVSPTAIELPAKKPLASFTVQNDRDRETSMEVFVFDWKQDAKGANVLTPVNDLVVTPSVFLVSARGAQTIRIGFTGNAGEQREKSYRMLLRELPNPERQVAGGLNLLIEMSMPVFVASGGRGALSACKVDAHTLELRNIGESHIKLGAAPGAESPVPRYLLPGAAIQTPMQSGGIFRALTLTKGDREPQLSTLRVDDAPCSVPGR